MWMDKLKTCETVEKKAGNSDGIPIGDYNQEPTEDDVKYLGGQSPKTIEKAKKRKPRFKG